jgi:hypothetical protein
VTTLAIGDRFFLVLLLDKHLKVNTMIKLCQWLQRFRFFLIQLQATLDALATTFEHLPPLLYGLTIFLAHIALLALAAKELWDLVHH